MIDYYSDLAHPSGDNDKLMAKWIYGCAVINDEIVSTFSWNW